MPKVPERSSGLFSLSGKAPGCSQQGGQGGQREGSVCAHAGPRLTVALMARGWPRLEVLLREPSHLLGEAGVATQLGSWALGPEGGFILRQGSPFSSCQDISCAQPPNLPPSFVPLPGLRLPVPASCVDPARSYS